MHTLIREHATNMPVDTLRANSGQRGLTDQPEIRLPTSTVRPQSKKNKVWMSSVLIAVASAVFSSHNTSAEDFVSCV